ncbi:MAG TPA: ABC transporter substrate-binding protein [Spirochaetales bacterium]|nr:ABC transporter substrate-binding protein [Spirochaetales bacterium]
MKRISALSIACAALLAAGAQAAFAAGPQQVVFWAALGGNNGKLLEAAVSEYNASQKEVFVKYEFQGDYTATEQKFAAAIAAGAVPDLVMLEISRIPGFAYRKAIKPLDDLAKKYKLPKEDIPAALLGESTIDGKLYSLPQSRSMPVFYYNKDMLRAAGLPDKAPETWAELRKAAIAMTNKAEGRYGFGLQIGNPFWYFSNAVEGNGGTISVRKNGVDTPTFNDPAGVAGLKFWYDLVNADGGGRIYPGQGLATWEALQADFISGKVGMMFITTGWMGNIVKNSKFDVGVGMLPVGPGGLRKAPTGGNGIVIPAKAKAKNQDAAFKFLMWLSDTPQTSKWAMQTGYMPLRLSALGDPQMTKYFETNPAFKVAVEQMRWVSAFPGIKMNPKTEPALNVLWERIFVANEDVKKVCDEVAAQIAGFMKE